VLREQLVAVGPGWGRCGDTVATLIQEVQRVQEVCSKAEEAGKTWAEAAGKALVKEAAQVSLEAVRVLPWVKGWVCGWCVGLEHWSSKWLKKLAA
jgi:hypothetical protein